MLPQITYLILAGMGLLIDANQHGKPKTGKHSFWISIIGVGLQFGIMYWGGFFKGLFY